MAVSVNIPTNAAQDLKLSKLLTKVNADRVAVGLSTYADVNAMSTSILTDQLLSWVQAMRDAEAQQIASAYAAASNAVQNQVKTDLGL